jgi:hypothetical protein
MDNNTDSKYYTKFIKADNNTIINIKAIKWIKKMDDCLAVCTKSDGCVVNTTTHKICKINNYYSYALLDNHFN